MPTELKFNERTGNGDATQVVTYTTKDANHLLVWSFDEFRPTYNGGLIYVTANSSVLTETYNPTRFRSSSRR